MKVFKAEWTDTWKTMRVDYYNKYELPRVQCDVCGRTWGDGLFYYPVFDYEFLGAKEYSFENVVSVEEFARIKERVSAAAGRPVNLIPGASLGIKVVKTLTKKLDDFIWGTVGVPQISEHACELLEQEGIRLHTCPCPLKYRGQTLDTHLAIHLEPVAILDEDYLEEAGYEHCYVCDDYFAPLPKPVKPGTHWLAHEPEEHLVRKDRWPIGHHLVKSQETHRLLVSEEFIAAVQKHKLKGIQFLEFGEYVSGESVGRVRHGGQRATNRSKEGDCTTLKAILNWSGRPQPSGGRGGHGMDLILRALIVNPDEDKAEDAAEEPPPAAATEIARLLGGKVRPNQQHVINLALDEPAYAFEIPLNDKRFKARVCLSETAFSFDTKYRRGERATLEDALFCVSFKVPDATMFTKDRVAAVSKALGVEVYRQGFVEDEVVEKYLVSTPVRDCLAKIDFKPLVRLFLSPIQLAASSELSTPEACAAQVRVFMDLMNALACARKPEAVKKEKAKTAVLKRGAKGRPR